MLRASSRAPTTYTLSSEAEGGWVGGRRGGKGEGER